MFKTKGARIVGAIFGASSATSKQQNDIPPPINNRDPTLNTKESINKCEAGGFISEMRTYYCPPLAYQSDVDNENSLRCAHWQIRGAFEHASPPQGQSIDSESSFLNHQIEDSAVQLVRQEVAYKIATNKTRRAI